MGGECLEQANTGNQSTSQPIDSLTLRSSLSRFSFTSFVAQAVGGGAPSKEGAPNARFRSARRRRSVSKKTKKNAKRNQKQTDAALLSYGGGRAAQALTNKKIQPRAHSSIPLYGAPSKPFIASYVANAIATPGTTLQYSGTMPE